jgi:hypothetical protein
MNLQSGYVTPILGILCDGQRYQFFKFSGRRTRSAMPQFFRGEFPDGAREQLIPLVSRGSDIAALYRQSRAVCESLYYILLLGYHTSLEAFYNRSIERSKGQGRLSTPKWHNAVSLSKEAIRMALLARTQWEEKKIEESKGSAEKAVELIARRYVVLCPSLLNKSNRISKCRRRSTGSSHDNS